MKMDFKDFKEELTGVLELITTINALKDEALEAIMNISTKEAFLSFLAGILRTWVEKHDLKVSDAIEMLTKMMILMEEK